MPQPPVSFGGARHEPGSRGVDRHTCRSTRLDQVQRNAGEAESARAAQPRASILSPGMCRSPRFHHSITTAGTLRLDHYKSWIPKSQSVAQVLWPCQLTGLEDHVIEHYRQRTDLRHCTTTACPRC